MGSGHGPCAQLGSGGPAPIRFVGGASLTYLDQPPYLYCNHDPVNAVDPSGHGWWGIAGGLIGGFVGGVVGGAIGGPGGALIGGRLGTLVGGIIGSHWGDGNGWGSSVAQGGAQVVGGAIVGKLGTSVGVWIWGGSADVEPLTAGSLMWINKVLR